MRKEIVTIVQNFCKQFGLDYRGTWNSIYEEYGDRYNIYPHIHYQFGSKSKLNFLENYEELCGTLTKMYKLVKELKNLK